MTLETCNKRLEIAKSKGDPDEIAFWENRIAHKLTLAKYSQLKVSEVKDGKKSKR